MNKKNIYLFYLIYLLEGMIFYAPIATLYRAAVNISIFEITIIESICSVCCLIFEVPWGKVADRIGYRYTIILSSLFYLVSKIIFWRADSFGDFLIERILLAIAISGLSGCDSAMIYLSCKKEESQKVFSIGSSMGTIGMLLAAIIYTLFIGNQYRLAALLTVMSYSVMFLLSFGLQEVKEDKSILNKDNKVAVSQDSIRNDDKINKVDLKLFFEDKNYLMFLVGVALLNEVHQLITTFLCQLKYQQCDISVDKMGKIYILITLVGLMGVFSARITKVLGRKNFIKMTYLLATGACMVMAVTKKPLAIVVSVVVLRLASSLFGPLQMQIQNEVVHTKNRATALSVNALFMDSISIGTNLIFGKIADSSLMIALICSGITCIVGMGLVNKIRV